jgi:hypothetical protein
LYREVDVEPDMQELGATLEHLVKPSNLVFNTTSLTEEGYKHAELCFYPV